MLGYTIVNDITSHDPWLDGDQWLLGKSMPGFCPVGPWIVHADELDPADLRLGCTSTASRSRTAGPRRCASRSPRSSTYLGRHMMLRPGDLIATGTPARLATPPGPDRHLEPGDVMTAWIEGIGRAHQHHRLTRGKEDVAMKPPTVFLGEMTNPEVEAFLREHQTVIVPSGSTEQHGPHGPLLTDVLIPTGGRPANRRPGRRRRGATDQLRACRIRTLGSPAWSTCASRRSWR